MSTKIEGFTPIHIDDVASGLSGSVEGFAQLSALLAAVCDKTPEFSDARKLAALGRTVACDLESFAGCILEQMQKGGIRQ